MGQQNNSDLILKVNNHLKPNRFGRGGFTTQLISREFHEKFNQKHPQYKKDYKEFVNDWVSIVDGMSNIVMDEADGVALGNNMGEFRLGLLRVHNIIDKKTSGEVGKPVKFLNYHTNKKPGKFIWKTEYARIVHFFLRYLGFKASRAIQAKCMNNMRDNGGNYKDVTDNFKFIK